MNSKNKSSLIWKIALGFFLGVVLGIWLEGMIAPFKDAVPGAGAMTLDQLHEAALDLMRSEGHWMPTALEWLNVFGQIFLRLLKVLIIPLVLSSLIVGVASLGSPSDLGRIGIKTIALYLLTTVIAIVIGLVLANITQPGAGFSSSAVSAAAQIEEAPSMASAILDMFPSNIIEAGVNEKMLQIIVFALMFGIACMMAGDKGKLALDFFESVSEVMYKMVDIIMRYAPVGVFALIAVSMAKYGAKSLIPLVKVIVVVYVACFIQGFIVFGIMIFVGTGKSPMWFFRGIKEAAITAFVTRSSSGTLPVTMECCRNMGIPQNICSFVLPLGATINMNGTAIYLAVSAIFIGQAFGTPLSIEQQIGVIVTGTLAAVGTAGIPGAGLLMLAIVSTQAGLNPAGIGILAGIDAVLDMIRASVNIVGDAACAAVVAKTEGVLSDSPVVPDDD